jgi:FAD/FMN-containing dehydrogenase/Fe-S oxidoreductase
VPETTPEPTLASAADSQHDRRHDSRHDRRPRRRTGDRTDSRHEGLPAGITPADLAAALRGAGIPEALDDGTTRALYSSDASLYRVPPAVVVRPRSVDEVPAVLAVCRELGVPLTSRGAGTSVAGNAVGSGVVLDFSRHLDRVLDVDPESRVGVVEPGTVQAVLQKAAAPHGLRFGPDPSTHARCTIGGMIGNNACGARTLAYGRTSDNVVALDVLTGTGTRLRLDSRTPGPPASGADEPAELVALRHVVEGGLATIRTAFGTFGRQVSGYALEHLLPERGFDVTRALVGSEGTLAVVLGATVRLVADPPLRTLVVLGYPDIATAGDAAPAVLEYGPTACEGLDARIVDVVRERKGPGAVPPLPDGAAWLLVEVSGESAAEVADVAKRLAAGCGALASEIVDEPAARAALWRIREDGAGLSGRTPAGVPAHSGWEDAAVPPAALGAYLRDFDALLTQHGLRGLPYGHFGDGCLHIRLDFPFGRADGAAVFRAFMTDAARLVAGYGGSLSGEHGDGRARSELLPLMYPEPALDLFAQVKAVFDPDDRLNPGVIVRPRPLDADLRVQSAPPLRRSLALAYHHDGGDFAEAVHRCTGVGKCRADNTGTGGVMCPSYLATREEKDSTRGRARVLQEMVNGSRVHGWRAPEVHRALDLCLSCKGCASDCPTGVDMAAYKAEVLHQAYRRRPRPRSHYALGWLPRWARLASRTPALANALVRAPGVSRLAKAAAGVDRRRELPTFAARSFRRWWVSRPTVTAPATGSRGPVVLWVDTFTNAFSPDVGIAAVQVLEDAGYEVRVPDGPACCGLTWISTGQLHAARRILGRTVRSLRAAAGDGVPIVGLEPSCTAVLRSEARELLPPDEADPVAAAVRTLAELLASTDGWEPPSLAGTAVVAQPHCHHHAVLGWSPDAELLRRAGADVTRLGGCCGLAGNFGVERGHYEVSVAVAEQQLLPAVRAAADGDVLLADGFSCRTQLADLTSRRGVHLAQLLASRR